MQRGPAFAFLPAMKLRLLLLAMALSPGITAAQSVAVTGFGFNAGVTAHRQVDPAALLEATLSLRTPLFPAQAMAGSSVADLKNGRGAQRDVFISASALKSLGKYFDVGAGIGLHSLGTRVAGSDFDPASRALERQQSGLRAAVSALSTLRLPLAPSGAASVGLTARATLMRSIRQFSISLGMQLSPHRGGLALGERAHKHTANPEAARTWDAVVSEIVLQQDAFAPLSDVIATRNALLLKFESNDSVAVADAVARIARMLNGSSEAVFLTISAPDPLQLAVAATSGGFPPERITLLHNHEITLQARRQPAALASHSAQSSLRQ